MKCPICMIINWFKRPAPSVVVTPLFTTDHDGRVIKASGLYSYYHRKGVK